ncbi:hypothetical protein P8452_41824 [Trifolium repens]|nr:hypothetical protein P8452_41824 [Trifolium repens]
MPIAINQDINTWFGSRRRICHMETVHVKDVAYGEIDPYFAHKYVDELDEELKLYSCGYLHLCTWNRDVKQPRITTGWTEIRPVTEPMLCPIVYNGSKFEILGWQTFCNDNGFYDGDIVKFTFFDIEKSWRVDV